MALTQRLRDRVKLYRGKARVFYEITVSIADGGSRVPFHRLVERIAKTTAIVRVVVFGDDSGDDKFHIHPVVHLDIDIPPESSLPEPLIEDDTRIAEITTGAIIAPILQSAPKLH